MRIMEKYFLHGKLRARKGNGEKLASILLEASMLMTNAKGCHLYIVSKDRIQSDTIWITEIWESKGDHDNSLKIEGVRELISTAMPILDGPPEKGQELDVLGGLEL